MKSFSFFYLFLLFTYSLESQSELVQGELADTKHKINYSDGYTAENFENIYCISRGMKYSYIKEKKRGLYIDHYRDLKLIKQKELDPKEIGDIKEIFAKNDSIFLISFKNDKKRKSLTHYLWSASSKDMNFKSEILYEINKDQFKKYFSIGIGIPMIGNGIDQAESLGYGDMFFSKNKNYFAIVYDIKSKDKQANKVVVYNNNFDIIFETDYKDELDDRLFDLKNVVVDDFDGSLYLIGKSYLNESRKNKKNGEVNYDYKVIKLKENYSKALKINTSGTYINDLRLIDLESQMFLIGYYSNKTEGKQQGIFISKINKDELSQDFEVLNKFSQEYIQNATIKRKKKDFVRDYEIEEFYSIDSNYYLISEIKDIEWRQLSTNRSIGYNVYGNLAINKIDSNGNITGSKFIYKDNLDDLPANRSRYSTLIGKYGNNIKLYFLSGKVKKNDKIVYKRGKNSWIFELEVDKDLNIKESFHNWRYFQIAKALKLDDGMISFMTYRKGKKLLIFKY